MSALMVAKIGGDVDRFRQALADRGDEFAKIAEDARTKGALHHRFGVGDGFVLVVDEWESADAFTQFFSDPGLQSFIASVGGDTSTPPDITITEAISSPDEF
jgi:quinol monooxygenase YgiN